MHLKKLLEQYFHSMLGLKGNSTQLLFFLLLKNGAAYLKGPNTNPAFMTTPSLLVSLLFQIQLSQFYPIPTITSIHIAVYHKPNFTATGTNNSAQLDIPFLPIMFYTIKRRKTDSFVITLDSQKYGEPALPKTICEQIRMNFVKFYKLAKKYGPVFRVQMGPKKVVLAGETVKDALVNFAEEFGERGKDRIFEDIDNNLGLAFSHGKNWKVMRRFTLTTLRDLGMGKSSAEQKVIEECAYIIQSFQSFKGMPFDDHIFMKAAVANIIVSILLGHRMDYEDPKLTRLLNLVTDLVRCVGSRATVIYNIFPLLGFLPGDHKTAFKHVDVLHKFIRKTFVKHLRNLDENDQRSFIDAYLIKQQEEANNPNSLFHQENLVSLVRGLFIAGIESTSTTLRWGLLLMMNYPDIQGKIQEEISRVIGFAQPMYSHRTQMPYTYAVIHEIQRFADIVPLGLPRETTKDVTFKGYFLPKETYIIPLLSSVLRDKTQFERPEEFYPNHFLDSEGNFLKKDAFMPFSAGRRACVGETLARMELFIFFTSLLQKFTIHFPPGVSSFDLQPGPGFVKAPKQHTICAVSRF
ncbi:LOW QUALITY PROTEIN: cytochrome P450 2K6-like [Gastrophryne carolinensis]